MDRRELLHLDWPRRRPARPGASWPTRGRRSTSAGGAGVDPGDLAAGAGGGADRRRQRLVLVVRRRPLVGARPGVRRPVPAPPAERLPAAADSRSPTSCSSATSRPGGRDHRTRARPASLTPTLDGEETSYFEWLGAGAVEVSDAAGAMHQARPQPRLLTAGRFGFDRERALRPGRRRRAAMADLLADGYRARADSSSSRPASGSRSATRGTGRWDGCAGGRPTRRPAGLPSAPDNDRIVWRRGRSLEAAAAARRSGGWCWSAAVVLRHGVRRAAA